jgi:hypothetical protein
MFIAHNDSAAIMKAIDNRAFRKIQFHPRNAHSCSSTHIDVMSTTYLNRDYF